MYRKIIVGYQHDERGKDALALASALAEPASANVIVATVLDTRGYWGMDHTVIDDLENRATTRIAEAIRGWPLNVKSSPRILRGTSAAGAIHALAEDERADLIVLGSTHMGRVGRALVGTSAEHVLYDAPCPVAVAPSGYERPLAGIRSVGVAFDASTQSRVALTWAAGTAAEIGAGLRVIAVIAPPAPSVEPRASVIMPIAYPVEEIEQLREAMLEKIRQAVSEQPYDLPVELDTLVGHPTAELRRAAGQGIDLLVAGSRGYGPVKGVLLGSVSAALSRSCSAPLVVVPRGSVTAGERRGAADGGIPAFSTGQYELSPREVAELLDSKRAQIVDVRDEYQLESGYLPGSRHIALSQLASEAGTLDRERPVVFYSGSGERAGLAMHACRALGMTAYTMRGGLRAWIDSDLPIESEERQVTGPAAR